MNTQEAALKARTSTGRLFALDALRGLAAFAVVLHHFHFALKGGNTQHWFLRPLIAGHESVLLFFVLSGYVLSVGVWRGKQQPYKLYLVRRIARIYLPYAAAVIVAALVGRNFVGSHLPLGPWFYLTWQEPINLRVLLSGLLMAHSYTLNTAFWSLRYEMQMSIVFPFLCFLILKLRNAGTLILIVVLTCISVMLARRDINPHQITNTLRIATYFIAGALAAKHQERWTTRWKLWTMPVKSGFLLMSILLYYRCFGLLQGRMATRLGLSDGTEVFRADTLVAMGALILVLISASSKKMQSFLENTVFDYLGRVSYSLYLLHGTVLFALLNLLYGKVHILLLGFIYLVVTSGFAHLFLITVEEPSLRLGKRLTSKKVQRSIQQVEAG